ncbi:MAG: thioredoxin-dependent thiol peroxidase [Mangrovibacterium sp.]
MAQLEKDTKAPEFSGENQNGKLISLADFAEKKLILYFYPKDNTPGCTAEACNLSDNYDFWIKQGYEVLGVSPDSKESHQKFIAKYALPFDLLSDPNHEILAAYGAWGEKNLYGKITVGVIRTTYVINENGLIEEVFKRPKTKEHTEQIAKKLEISE